jgi:hypothetical protein
MGEIIALLLNLELMYCLPEENYWPRILFQYSYRDHHLPLQQDSCEAGIGILIPPPITDAEIGKVFHVCFITYLRAPILQTTVDGRAADFAVTSIPFVVWYFSACR